MTKENRIRLKGHETFILREGWLTKGLIEVKRNPRVFLQNAGADDLGVGTNMAKAIRYWLREGGFIREKVREGAVLTDVGALVYKYDRYLEKDFSLWLFHCNLAGNSSRVTSWYVFFNLLESEEFKRDELFWEMKDKIMQYGGTKDISERSLWDDCTALLNMYCRQREDNYDPEDKKVSPFSHLGLIRKSGSRYKKSQPDYNTLNPLVVWYLIQNFFHKTKTDSIHIDQLLRGENLPGKVLNMTRVSLNQYLDELSDEGYIIVNRTAGLDMVYKNKMLPEEKAALLYYKKGNEDVSLKRAY